MGFEISLLLLLPTTTEPSADTAVAALWSVPGRKPRPTIPPPEVQRIACWTPVVTGLKLELPTTTDPSAETADP